MPGPRFMSISGVERPMEEKDLDSSSFLNRSDQRCIELLDPLRCLGIGTGESWLMSSFSRFNGGTRDGSFQQGFGL